MPRNSGGKRKINRAALIAIKSKIISKILLSDETTGKRTEDFLKELLLKNFLIYLPLTTISLTAEETPGPNFAAASILSQFSLNQLIVCLSPSSKDVLGL